MRLRLLCAAAAALTALLASAAPAAALDRPIVFAFDRDFPPFSTLRLKEPSGFEVELLFAALRNKGFKITAKPMEDWDRAMSELSAGSVSVVSGMTRSEMRDKLFLFPDEPSLELQCKFFVSAKSGFAGVDNLKGKTVAVRKGTLYQSMLEQWGFAKVKPVPSHEEGLKAVWRAEADAFFGPDKEAYFYIDKNEYKDIAGLGQALERTALWFAVYREDKELAAALGAGLREARLSGEYDRIYRKYFVAELPREQAASLVNQAKAAAAGSYAPYTREKAGAALLTRNGRTYTGARMENAQPDLTLGPFAVALAKAATAGDVEILAAAGVSSEGKLILPTAQERQMLYEFGPGLLVLVEPTPGSQDWWTIPRLLPLGATSGKGRSQARPAPAQ